LIIFDFFFSISLDIFIFMGGMEQWEGEHRAWEASYACPGRVKVVAAMHGSGVAEHV